MRATSARLAQLVANSVARTLRSTAPVLYTDPQVVHARRKLPARVGLCGYKRGMVPFFRDGKKIACTVLEIDRCQVTDVKTATKHGYYAVQVACGEKRPHTVTRQMLGHFARARVAPKHDVAEFQVQGPGALLPLGTLLRPSHLRVGQFVDVQSKTKGKGFQGVMKRWGFHGQPASHGNSKTHRAPGSIGQNTDPARVFPGKKMAGRMGFDNCTVQNLEVLEVDDANGLVLLAGHVAGAPDRLVKIRDSIKAPPVDPAPAEEAPAARAS